MATYAAPVSLFAHCKCWKGQSTDMPQLCKCLMNNMSNFNFVEHFMFCMCCWYSYDGLWHFVIDISSRNKNVRYFCSCTHCKYLIHLPYLLPIFFNKRTLRLVSVALDSNVSVEEMPPTTPKPVTTTTVKDVKEHVVVGFDVDGYIDKIRKFLFYFILIFHHS